MPAGTIALTNGSATVTGTGTSFTTELKTGDFLGVVVGGVPYTLIVSSIASSTSLKIAAPFTGPTTNGLAWYAVPATLQTAITQQAMNDMSKIIRGMIQEKANWQQVYSGTGNITVKLPDGSTYSGPAWNSISDLIANKAVKGDNNDIKSLTGLTTALSIAQGGTGQKTLAAALTSFGFKQAIGRIAIPYDGGSVVIQGGNQIVTTDSNGDVNIVLPQILRNLYGMICQSADSNALNGAISINAYNYSGVRIHCTTATGAVKANSSVRIMYLAIGDIA